MAKITKIATPVWPQKTIENSYRIKLNKLGRTLIKAVRDRVLAYLKMNESGYVVDAVGDDLARIFNELNSVFTGVITAGFADEAATSMVNTVERTQKRQFDNSIERAVGVDLGGIIQVEGLQDFLNISISNNVSLIKSIPTQYFQQIENIVKKGVVSGSRYATIEKQIISETGINSKLAKRIKLIATDQVQTITSQLNVRRSQALGITEGIYRTSEDKAVRVCHKELNGVRYELSKGAWSKICQKWIQPGITDIRCRCAYSPIIEWDSL
jgi:SPP1 gp7 family putative phage head morphogenesis protein